MFTLAIDNVVEVPVKFTLKSGAVNKQFSATLIANRLSPEQAEEQMEGLSVKDFLLANITGWRDQRLVLDADGKPAEFSVEALSYFLRASGVLSVAWASYLQECGAKAKN